MAVPSLGLSTIRGGQSPYRSPVMPGEQRLVAPMLERVVPVEQPQLPPRLERAANEFLEMYLAGLIG